MSIHEELYDGDEAEPKPRRLRQAREDHDDLLEGAERAALAYEPEPASLQERQIRDWIEGNWPLQSGRARKDGRYP